MAKKKSKRKPAKPTGPNPMYPTQSVLKKLARILVFVKAGEHANAERDARDDHEVDAWLIAMIQRGAVK